MKVVWMKNKLRTSWNSVAGELIKENGSGEEMELSLGTVSIRPFYTGVFLGPADGGGGGSFTRKWLLLWM
jgi:hypothetical protein